MKKSRLKMAIKTAMKVYYKAGLTNTAHNVEKELMAAVDRAYNSK